MICIQVIISNLLNNPFHTTGGGGGPGGELLKIGGLRV